MDNIGIVVESLDNTLARLQAHGAALVSEIVQLLRQPCSLTRRLFMPLSKRSSFNDAATEMILVR